METIYLLRHGETQWSKSGQHTGFTDLPLTEEGENQAKRLAERLKKLPFDHVFSSPLIRAFDTCKICGLAKKAQTTDALLEWNYGDYEGKKTAQIHESNPAWNVFTHGAPNGESVEDITARLDPFIKQLISLDGTIALFTSGHISRAFAARWVEYPTVLGKVLTLSTASLSILGFEHSYRVIRKWNDTSHLL